MCMKVIFFFFFNDTATTEIYTLSLHDALPIFDGSDAGGEECSRKAAPHAAHHVSQELQPQRRHADGFGGELVILDRNPSSAQPRVVEVVGEDHRDCEQDEADDEKISLCAELVT